ncbi:MAG: hypothetical protein E7Z87_08220 [Cyanobacteria bacterium SIG26]|nr:hypothetical protein [Cyanobacteria bacterium SIG26]
MMKRKGLDVEEKNLNELKVHKPKDFSYTTKYFNTKKAQMDMVFNQILPDLRELSEFFAPRMSRFLVNDVNKPIKRSKKVINSITLTAVKNFASGMQSGATSAANRWFKIQMKNKKLNDVHDVRVWCSQVEDLYRRIYSSSNFYQNMLGVYKQLGTFGFAVLLMESDYKTVVNFKLLPIGSYRYAKDHRGDVDTVCRHFKEYAKNIVDKYGYENCSESVKTAYDNGSDSQFELVYFVELNKQYNPNSPLSKYKKYISATYIAGEDKFLKLSGFDKFPFAVFESEVNGEDVYPSNCPGIDALPDARQLMMETKEFSKALKKIVTPSYKGPASLQKYKGLMDAPGQIVPEDENGRGLSPMYEVKPQVLEISNHIEKLEDVIKQHFHNDMFAVILNTAERGRTATEVNEIKEEKMVLLSPILDQVHKGLRSVQDFVFAETIETEILPLPPKVIQQEEMETEFVSALALAQKVKGIASIERFTTFTTNIAMAIDPTLLKKINGDKIVDDYAEIANVNPEYVVPTEEVNKYREQLAQQQAQQEQLQQLQQGSEMIKNMGGVDAVGADLASRMGM